MQFFIAVSSEKNLVYIFWQLTNDPKIYNYFGVEIQSQFDKSKSEKHSLTKWRVRKCSKVPAVFIDIY